MNLRDVMAELERCGDEACRNTLLRHGAEAPLFGVRYADLYRIQRRLGVDTALARALWVTGNHDACVLATLVADPAALGREEIDSWLADAGNRLLNDAVATVAARSPHARELADAWRRDGGEWRSAAGWGVVGRLALDARADEGWLAERLEEIRDWIHAVPNMTRHAMNNALIAIGGSRPALTKRALAVAKEIGKVEVDHGDTACKTPDATGYIRKMIDRRQRKAPPAGKPAAKRKAATKRAPAAPRKRAAKKKARSARRAR